jgi:hypothetical protein
MTCPADNPVMVEEVVELGTVTPVDHLYVHGPLLPIAVAVAVPPVGLLQVLVVDDIVGGQQEP